MKLSGEKFDTFINWLIYAIHEGIIAYRRPWKPKKINKLDLSKFELVFEDHFDGESLNKEIWGQHPEDGIRKGGYWDLDGQTFLKDSCLYIRTEYKENGKYGSGYYTANVSTRDAYEQTFGYFECRCKLPAAEGMWSAFWLMTQKVGNFVPGKIGTEIDVFESPIWWRGKKGKERNLVSSNLHYGGYELGHRYKNVAVTRLNDPYNEFNVYGVEWNKNGYIFYINGIQVGKSKFGGVCESPEYFRCSCEVDGTGGKPTFGWSGKITRGEAGELPADFIIDYVRTYQYK